MSARPTALITGASSGIGTAIAAALAPTHALVLAGRPSPRLRAVADRFGADTVALDLGAVHTAVDAAGLPDDLDVLVHNAGVALPARVAESDVAQWRTTLEVNVVGAVGLTLALLPALRRAGGQVVFVNSGSGLRSSPGLASYSASKAALRAFADSLREDEPALRVTSVHPGRTDTAMQRTLVDYEGGDYDPARFLRPETVAAVVADAVATPPDGHVHQVVLRPR
ncbi:SDR family oxidoreductase [Mycolicibacillus parakoreensis]|uniref:SDR family oxidoreductase n=1 Tax=Mycolicibacillus parakoreensis TaxID=1069221 RepID=A0ABY3U5Z3_9MYCO|nr:SDR family oxidoreductase [Mycolicibacillus parakoreensis]MCV7316595.1 SDR family oxidoreductase [Mycolicibacillus parakoreensis]ULN52809.1 SDR family oxidoreductase [Mycolicibacillus parakoreensis]